MLGKRKKETEPEFMPDEGPMKMEPPLRNYGHFGVQTVGEVDGRATVIIQCLFTQRVLEERHNCQLFMIDANHHVCVADPAGIKIYKMPWNVRLLRWLVRLNPSPRVLKNATIKRNPESAGN